MQAHRQPFFRDGYISLFVFLRYYWRAVMGSIFFYINAGWVLFALWAGRHPSPATLHFQVHVAMLVWMLLTLGFSVIVWRFKSILKPLAWRDGTRTLFHVARIGSPDSTRTQAMWHLWWSFNWRYAVVSIIPFMLFALSGAAPERVLQLDAVASLWTGWAAMWWMLFHPYGKTMVMLTREES